VVIPQLVDVGTYVMTEPVEDSVTTIPFIVVGGTTLKEQSKSFVGVGVGVGVAVGVDVGVDVGVGVGVGVGQGFKI